MICNLILATLTAAATCGATHAAATLDRFGLISYKTAAHSGSPIGPIASGVGVSLTPAQGTMSIGDPYALTIEVRNVSSSDVAIYSPEDPCSYKYRITDVSSKRSWTYSQYDQGVCLVFGDAPGRLAPNTSLFLTAAFKGLDAQLSTPGVYEVCVSAIRWIPSGSSTAEFLNVTSNIVEIDATG